VLKVICLPAAGMKPPLRVAFGRLEVENRSLGLQYRKRGVVFGGDQIDCVLDTLFFSLYDPENFRIMKVKVLHYSSSRNGWLCCQLAMNKRFKLSPTRKLKKRFHHIPATMAMDMALRSHRRSMTSMEMASSKFSLQI
jgi:hypothetical protein